MWFQNRRAKFRKQERLSQQKSSSSSSSGSTTNSGSNGTSNASENGVHSTNGKSQLSSDINGKLSKVNTKHSDHSGEGYAI